MDLVHDYLHSTPAGGQCRIRIYIPEEPDYSAVVICTELTDNPGMSVTNCAEVIAASIVEANGLEAPTWIEHYEDGARGYEQDPETFDLVTFTNYEPKEFAGVHGPHKRIGRPSWKALDRPDSATLDRSTAMSTLR